MSSLMWGQELRIGTLSKVTQTFSGRESGWQDPVPLHRPPYHLGQMSQTLALLSHQSASDPRSQVLLSNCIRILYSFGAMTQKKNPICGAQSLPPAQNTGASNNSLWTLGFQRNGKQPQLYLYSGVGRSRGSVVSGGSGPGVFQATTFVFLP